MKQFNIAIVGDECVGKTSLPFTYMLGDFLKEDLKICTDCCKNRRYLKTIDVDDTVYMMNIWVNHQYQTGNERPLQYRHYYGTDCVIICYSIANKISYKNVRTVWYPEIKKCFSKQIPIILVGTKLDLREQSLKEFVKTKKGMKLKKKIKARAFLECSALNQTNLAEVFEEAVRAIELSKTKKKKKSTCFCF